ncbi:MAG: hypothetical protein MK212_00645 [Saprospiraceae bacterium]|nr:hypothetical protein [Saprospiraceae bacterium]
MRRKILSLESAHNILEPYLEDLVASIRNGFEDYLKISQYAQSFENKISYKVRTKASIIHEHISGHLSANFQKYPDVTAKEWNNIFGLKIKNDLFLRVKKLNPDYSITSYMTKQAKDYLRQLSIPGFPEEPTLLIAGYIPEYNWSGIRDICITCWDGEHLRWIFDVEQYAAEQIELPFAENIDHREVIKRANLIIRGRNINLDDSPTNN